MSEYYNQAEVDRLTAQVGEVETKRSEIATRMHDMHTAGRDTAWDSTDHLKFNQLKAEHDMLDGDCQRMERAIDRMKANRPKTDAEIKSTMNRPLNRLMTKGAEELTPDERIEQQDLHASFGNEAVNPRNPHGRSYVVPFPEWGQPEGRPIPRTAANERSYSEAEYNPMTRLGADVVYNAPTQPGDTGLSSTITEHIDLNYFQPMTAYGNALGAFSSIFTPDGNDTHFFVAPDDSGLATGPTANLLSSQTENALPDTWDKLTIAVQMYTTGFMDLSRYLKEDAQFDVEAWVMGVAYRRVGRKLEQQAANGTGAQDHPRGFFTASEDFNQTAGGGAAFRWADSIDIEHAIDYAYLFGMEEGLHGYSHRPGETCYITSWQYMSVLKKLQDADNRPLYLPNIHTRHVFDLNGYNIKLCHEFLTANQTNGNNKKPIVFGNFGQLVQRWAGAGLMIEQFYDSATALNNTTRYMGRWRWGAGIVGPYNGNKNSPTMKSKSLKTLVLKT